ncbi:hypothetical protein CRG98_045712 [Punica granatum]|uniref:Uncharacterized protein n=1 Tax=Punica granatum TaxID=22663 RepID=A0A2I0HQ96_PUNGR|nr:hypothetical protein CRG98_045712 [Punica granatum]
MNSVLERKSKVKEGLGLPIGDPDPSTEVAGILRGYRRTRRKGQGHRLTPPAPESTRGSESEFPIDLRAGVAYR